MDENDLRAAVFLILIFVGLVSYLTVDVLAGSRKLVKCHYCGRVRQRWQLNEATFFGDPPVVKFYCRNCEDAVHQEHLQ